MSGPGVPPEKELLSLEEQIKVLTQRLADAEAALHALAARQMDAVIEPGKPFPIQLKETQFALQESETRFRNLTETTSAAIFIVQEQKIAYASPAATYITGYAHDELLRMDFWQIAHPAYQSQFRTSSVANLWAAGIPTRYELKLLTREGEERWVDVSAGVISYQGSPALVVTAFDITERDRVEKELQQAKRELETRVNELQGANEDLYTTLGELEVAEEELRLQNEELTAAQEKIEAERKRYQDLFEFAPDGYLVTDSRGIIQEANQAAARLLNIEQGDLIGKPFTKFISRKDLSLFNSHLSTLSGEKLVRDWEVRLRTRTGNFIEAGLAVVGVPAGDSGSTNDPFAPSGCQPYTLRWLIRNITKRKNAERALLNTNELLEKVFSSIDLLVAYLDRDFNFLRVNQNYAAYGGHPPEYFLGKNHFDLFPNEENEEIFKRVVECGEAYSVHEKPFTYPEFPERGTTYWNWSLQPVKDASGAVQGVVLSLLDVTSRRKAEDELRQLSTELEYRVQERTAELSQANAALVEEIARREQAEKDLLEAQVQLESRIQERTAALAQAVSARELEIAERKKAMDQIRLQAAALEAAAEGIMITDRDGIIQWVNPAFERMSGYTFEAVAGQTPRFLRSGEHPDNFYASLWSTILTGEVWFGETVNRRKDGSLYIEEQTIAPLVDETGCISHFIAVKHDISQRKLAEDLLRRVYQSESSQRQFAEALAQAAVSLNASLKLDEVLDLILDQTLRVVPGYGVNIIFVENDTAFVARYRGYLDPAKSLAFLGSQPIPISLYQRQMATTGQPVLVPDTQDDPLWEPAPGLEWLRSYVGVPLRSIDQTIGFLQVDSDQPGFFKDETPKRLEAFAAHAALAIQNARLYENLEKSFQQEQAMRSQLVQAEKYAAMGRMVASVAHELNNPLQTIKNCLFLIEQDLKPRDNAQEYLQMASSETQRISKLVMQLREIYRPKGTAEMSPVDLVELLDEIRTLIAPQMQHSRVRWEFQAPVQEPVIVKGIPDQLKQVFLNISDNAIDAMQPNGGELNVSLTASPGGRRMGVVFQDTGPGIEPENFNRIFDPLFTTKAGGTGLGLAISFEIIQRHAGIITVDSPPGEGAKFTVWLPL